MTTADTTTDTTSTDDTSTTTDLSDTGTDTGPDLAKEVAKWKTQSRKHEDRAKANAGAAAELDKLKQSSMSDQEKAVEVAKAEARTATIVEMGGRLAAAEIKAAATGRLAPEQVSTLVDGLNLASFLDAEGEVDAEKVKAFVDGIAPPKTEDVDSTDTVLQQFDLGQGARGDQTLAGDAFTKELLAKVGGPRR